MSGDQEVTYEIHSMMVKGVVDLQPTKLEMLDSIEESATGYIYTPAGSNIRVVITGRDWSEKTFLVYGCKSIKEAKEYIDNIIEKVKNIGHKVGDVRDIEAVNIAVNGDFHERIRIEALTERLSEKGIDAEYEPEQFPGLIIHLEEPPVTFLIFASGKFVIQGVNSPTQIEPSISRMKSLIQS
jgi:TATA-box binding protein (TBP) (component of TFIID and TFIIIB)